MFVAAPSRVRAVTATGSFNLRSPYLWDQSALYTTGDVTLAALPGDANADGVVDFDDLVALAQNYNVADAQRGWADGDFTFDGRVDFNDLVALAQNYNTSFIQPADALPSGTTPELAADWVTATNAVAPEPGGAVVVVAVAGISLVWRRNRGLRG